MGIWDLDSFFACSILMEQWFSFFQFVEYGPADQSHNMFAAPIFPFPLACKKIPLKTRFAEHWVRLDVAWLVNGLQQLAHGHEPPPLQTGVLNYWINSSLSKDRGDRATALGLGRWIALLYKKLGLLSNVKICLQSVWPKINAKLELW